jgi:hypothetical protein
LRQYFLYLHHKRHLAVVLSVDEVWHILAHIQLPQYRACLSTIYTCCLRLQEGVHLTIAEFDSARMQLPLRVATQIKRSNNDIYRQSFWSLRHHHLPRYSIISLSIKLGNRANCCATSESYV